jgi:hypothetical protein
VVDFFKDGDSSTTARLSDGQVKLGTARHEQYAGNQSGESSISYQGASNLARLSKGQTIYYYHHYYYHHYYYYYYY